MGDGHGRKGPVARGGRSGRIRSCARRGLAVDAARCMVTAVILPPSEALMPARMILVLLVAALLSACGEATAPQGCATPDEARARAERLGADFAAALGAGRFDGEQQAALAARMVEARAEVERTRDWDRFCQTLGMIRRDAGLDTPPG